MTCLVIFLPQWLDSVWSLAERIRGSPITIPQLAISPVGLVMFGIAIWAIRSKPTAESIGIDKASKGLAIAKRVASILEKIEKRDLQLKDATVKQYKVLFSFNDLLALLDSIGSTDSKYVKVKKSIAVKFGNEKLKQDQIERRQQIDNMFKKARPAYAKEMTLEQITAYGNKLDTFPKMQNPRYKGIRTRRERDKRWRKIFTSLSKVKLKYPSIFANNELNLMINEYIDVSYAANSICFSVDLVNWYTPVENQPTAYIDSGAYAPYVKLQERMAQLRKDVSNKIIEIASELDNEQRPISKTDDGNSKSKTE